MKLDAVFFDMDGLMIDSESGGITACQKAGAHFGLPAGEVDRYAHLCIGANTRHSRELFLSMFPGISYENFSSLSRSIRRQLQEEEGIPLKEGILPLLIHKGHNVFQPLIGNSRHERNHTLVILKCDTIQAFLGYTLYRDRSSPQHLYQLLGQLTLQLSLDQDLVYLFIRLNGFHHGTNAEYHLVFLHCYALLYS